ncbi:hypothetical protein [Aliikangiella coralliicola]|uniref:MSHA biogenesis protein MshK n=1 Tax=Aliikangiella coralliicola TaxID=2592383 RepID=A0A545UGC8_9GAMM|nr:hypothetical protein [Aliikangiella coralliicola]TQV88534.1 hypothetical protein FLL46_08420 [Aliikangiella coralliicola]
MTIKMALPCFCAIALAVSIASSAEQRDPTKPLIGSVSVSDTKPKTKRPKQVLTAIITRGKKRYAIIEGDTYRVGDTYRGSRIMKIYQGSVLISSANGSRRLTLIPQIKSK